MTDDPTRYLDPLTRAFKKEADPKIAAGAKAYLRHQFDFFGIPGKRRKELFRAHYDSYGEPEQNQLTMLIKHSWSLPEREYQYFAMDLVNRMIKHADLESIKLLTYMITRKSWWDTVDFIASWPVGTFFSIHRELISPQVSSWIQSDNIWLKRTCLLFQLRYKDQTDTELLRHCIEQTRDSTEFFLRKAIGWALRQYSKTNPDWVQDYVMHTELSPLSRKEALRLISGKPEDS